MAKFTCPANLILQDESGIWAEFTGGSFRTDDHEIADRLREVEGVTEVDDDQPAEADADDLDGRTVADLRDYAVEYGIDLDGITRKADIVAAIRAHFAALPDRTDD